MKPDGPGLRCFVCDGRILAVKDSRASRNAVRRRRRCLTCGAKFTTFEIMSPSQKETFVLFAALDYYKAMTALSEAQRQVVLAMVRALTPPPKELPPLIAGSVGQLSLDAALVGGDPEEAPYG